MFDLNGKYSAGGAPGPIIHLSGNSISVDMSAYHRPNASGTLILPTYGRLTFPDDKTVPNGTYYVYFTAPNTILFHQNKSTWQKTANLVGTLLMSIPAEVIETETAAAKTSIAAQPNP